MRFSLSSEALWHLRQIKSAPQGADPQGPTPQGSGKNPLFFQLDQLNADEQALLTAEKAIVWEHYSAIDDKLVEPCSHPIRKLILAYRDLFLQPEAAKNRIEGLLSDHSGSFSEAFLARLHFWNADAHHLTGEIEQGQRLLAHALTVLDRTGPFRAEALTVTALCEFLAGKTESAAHYHREAKHVLLAEPDLFLTIFNCGMALRTFLLRCDSIGFEEFSRDLDEALSGRPDRRYLLRQAGYRAMLMSIVGEREEALHLWAKADEVFRDTALAWERGQFAIMRGLAAALHPELGPPSNSFDLAEEQLRTVGFPGPYRAELDCARALVSWVAHRGKPGVQRLASSLTEGHALLQEKAQTARADLRPYYEQGLRALEFFLSGESPPPSTPSLIVSLVLQMDRSGAMTGSLADFRLLHRFVSALELQPLDADGIARSLQSALRLPVRINKGTLQVESPSGAQRYRPDYELTTELAATLLRYSDLLSRSARARALAQVSAQFAHDVRSPLAAMRSVLQSGEQGGAHERQLLAMAADRISDIARDLIEAHRGGNTNTLQSISIQSVVDGIRSLVLEKQEEYRDSNSVSLQLAGLDELRDAEECSTRLDFSSLKRALSNLINNAKEARPEGGRIECEVRLAPPTCLEIIVSDSGPGFSPETLRTLSAPQHEAIKSNKAEGMGLGLLQVRQFAAACSAELLFENRDDGNGARVRVRLPLLGVQSFSPPEPHRGSRERPPSAPPKNG
jgi:signal transduction histidine kinase